jgi:hypothetical protein
MIVFELIYLLKPFQHVLAIIQKGKTSSIHLVTTAVLTLCETLKIHESLIKYSKDCGINSLAEYTIEDEECVEEDEDNFW